MTVRVGARNQITQVGIEAVWGTKQAATIRLSSVEITDRPVLSPKKFKAAGAKGASVITRGPAGGEIGFTGPATVEELRHFIDSVPLDAATTLANKGLTIEKGQSGAGNAMIYTGGLVTAWTLRNSPEEIMISGNIQAAGYEIGALTAGLTASDMTPIENGDTTISIGGAVTNCLEWELAMSNLWALAHFVGSNEAEGANEGDIEGLFTATLEATAANKALIDDRTSKALEISLGPAGKVYVIKANLEIFDVQEFSAAGEVYALGLTYQVMNTAVDATTNIVDITKPEA